MNCKNCNKEATLNYCPYCGVAVNQKRISGQYIINEVTQVLNFDKGFLYTTRELLLRPGKSIQDFLDGSRSKLVKPVVFIIVTSLIYSLINNFFRVEEGYLQQYEVASEIPTIAVFTWIQQNYGYANILMGIFIAMYVKWFFRKYGYNFYEILTLICFVMGLGMLVFAFFALVEGITKLALLNFAGLIALFYAIWAIGQFFDKVKATSYLKALAAYIMGSVTAIFFAIAVGVLIEMLARL